MTRRLCVYITLTSIYESKDFSLGNAAEKMTKIMRDNALKGRNLQFLSNIQDISLGVTDYRLYLELCTYEGENTPFVRRRVVNENPRLIRDAKCRIVTNDD